MQAIYERPRDYDLEHEGDEDDIRFYLELTRRLRPRRVLEFASGSGRVTIPLARQAASLDYEIVGVEIADTMLSEAENKRAELATSAQDRVTFVKGDIRDWTDEKPFDLVITPCSSLSHMLTRRTRWPRGHALMRTWRRAADSSLT